MVRICHVNKSKKTYSGFTRWRDFELFSAVTLAFKTGATTVTAGSGVECVEVRVTVFASVPLAVACGTCSESDDEMGEVM